MTADDVILWTALAVVPAGIGAFVGARRLGGEPRDHRADTAAQVLAWANASAAGLMLGVAYAELTAGAGLAPLAATLGAAVGVTCTHAAGRGGTPAGIGAARRGAARAVVASALHSGAEGIAIGAAAVLDPTFGLFLALTFALHNLSEGVVLGSAVGAVLSGARAALAATVARAGQPVLAAITIAAVRALPGALPWTLGAAAGALVYLSLAELLPSSYRRTGRTSIAVVVSVAAGIVALLGGRVR